VEGAAEDPGERPTPPNEANQFFKVARRAGRL